MEHVASSVGAFSFMRKGLGNKLRPTPTNLNDVFVLFPGLPGQMSV